MLSCCEGEKTKQRRKKTHQRDFFFGQAAQRDLFVLRNRLCIEKKYQRYMKKKKLEFTGDSLFMHYIAVEVDRVE